MIVFKKLNDVYLKVIEGERHELKTLSEYFTFEVPGAKFSPAYKNKYWDGRLRLFNTNDYTIYGGLWKDIVEFSKSSGIDVSFEGSRYNFPGIEQPLDDEFADEFLSVLNPHSGGKPIEMRDYQVDAFKTAIRKQRALLLSPTASGKSLIIYSLIRFWQQTHNRKILIVVPTISLVTQMMSDFSDYSNGTFTDMHGIMGGVTKTTDATVVCSTWQSIFKESKEWFAQFGSVIVDEVHTATAKSIKGIMESLEDCPDRIGLTGTLAEAKTSELVLKGLFGPVEKMITTKELMDRKQIADTKINIVQFDYSKDDRKLVSNMGYQQEIDFLVNHERRNDKIAAMAANLPGNTLVVFQRIEHGKAIFDRIETPKQKLYVAGETDKDDRETARKLAEANDVIIVASLGVFSTGVNIKNLHNLIFAHPTKSKIKVLQSIGRVLRLAENKTTATVYDIVDDLKHKQRLNFALKHAEERFKNYVNEDFAYKIFQVRLHNDSSD